MKRTYLPLSVSDSHFTLGMVMRSGPFCVVLLAFCSPVAVAADDKAKEMTTRELVAKTKNAIVRISTVALIEQEVTIGTGKDAKVVKVEKEVVSGGTGFIVSGGYIVTNDHVLDVPLQPGQKLKRIVAFRGTFAFDTRKPANDNGPNPFAVDSISPELHARSVLDLEAVNRDSFSDLAVLRVKAIWGDVNGERRKSVEATMESEALKFAPRSETEVGDDVVAVGFPRLFAGPPTVTKGIVSALGRGLTNGGANFTDLIQTDAAINPGNSGGPLLDMRGRIVGVNTYSLNHAGTPGVGFARSARTAEPFVKMLQKGPIVRAVPGFVALPLAADGTDILGVIPGLFVIEVKKDSPADKAGVRRGDLVVSIGAERVSRAGDQNNALALAAGRNSVEVIVWRFSEADVKTLFEEGKGGITALKLRSAFDDGAIKRDTIKKIDLVMKLK